MGATTSALLVWRGNEKRLRRKAAGVVTQAA